jgi:hypothetical protein
MRLPLLVSGVSKKVTSCAIVRIPKGNWKLVVENWIDSKLELSPIPSVEHGATYNFNSPTSIQLCILEPGNETNLNVYFEST